MSRGGAVVLALLLLAVPAWAQTVSSRFDTFGEVITAAPIPANHFDVSRIELLWAREPLKPGDEKNATVLWRVDAVRPVDFRGFAFTLYQTPSGFQTITLHQAPGPATGVYMLAVHSAVPNGPFQGFRVYLSPSQVAGLMPKQPKL